MPERAAPTPSGGSRGRRLTLIAASAAIGSLGLAAGGLAGPLLAVELAGSESAAGLPVGILVAGSAFAALVIAKRSQAGGRERALVLGYAIGATGAATVTVAAATTQFGLLLAGSFLLGAGNPAIFLTRYAGAAAADPAEPGRGLGLVLFATAIGAVAAPNLLGPTGAVAQLVGLPVLSGLYLLAIAAFGLAAVLLHVADRAAAHGPAAHSRSPGLRQAAAALSPRARAGLGVLALTNFVMAGVMAIAPVHLHAHGHGLDQVGMLVGLHVVAMFAPGPLTGMLVDRLSPLPVILAAAALLAASCALLAGAAGSTFEWTVIGLVALGLGWNAGVVGGSALVTASVSAEAGSQVEGLAEVAMGAAAAVGTPLAGLGNGAAGFAAVSGVAAGLAVVLGLGTLQLAAGGRLARPIAGNLNTRPGRQT